MGESQGSFRNDAGMPQLIVRSRGATQRLGKQESGSIVLLDKATLDYTLPPSKPGLHYKFISTIASVAQQVNTDRPTVFLLGSINQIVDTSATSEGQFANGTSHIGIQTNGTTTGGLIGSWFEVFCLSETIWWIRGTLNSSGALATPFTT